MLILHGEKNRVFKPEGSFASFALLTQQRTGQRPARPDRRRLIDEHWGSGTPTQLRVFEGYGHLDTLIGRDAHRQVFPAIRSFFDSKLPAAATPAPPSLELDPPWIGPTMGWLQQAPGSSRVMLAVRLQPVPARSSATAVVVVPLAASRTGGQALHWDKARAIPWNGITLLSLDIDPVQAAAESFALYTVHRDLPLRELTDRFRDLFSMPLRTGPDTPEWTRDWLRGSAPLVGDWDEALRQIGPPSGLIHLGARVVAAADRGHAAAEPRPLHFAIASCQYPPGLLDEHAAGAALRALADDAAEATGPQFVLLLGDQVYVDAQAGVFEPAATRSSGSQRHLDLAYELNWRLPGFRRLAQRVPVLGMLDDHEVRDNWPGGLPKLLSPEAQAVEAFKRVQGGLNPKRGLGSDRTQSFTFFPAGVPFFVLDTRSGRELRDAADAIHGARILPDEVMTRLIEQLRSAPSGSAKFIASPVPLFPLTRLTPDEILRDDTWGGYPRSMRRLLGAIRKHNIRKVVLLAGDAHLSSVTQFRFDGSDLHLVSVVSSGLYTPWPFANQRAQDLVLDGPVDLGAEADGELPLRGTMTCHALCTGWGYARLQLAGDPTDPHGTLKVTLRAVDRPHSAECELSLT